MNSFKINSSILFFNIKRIAPIVKDNSPIPILQDLFFEISKDNFTITASNGEIRASVKEKIESVGIFSFCVSKNLIYNLLSTFSSTELNIELDKNYLIITAKTGMYSIPVCEGSQYPKQEDISDVDSFDVDVEKLLEGICGSIPFVDESLTNANGILIKSIQNKLHIVSASNSGIYEKSFDYNGNDTNVVLTVNSAKYLSQNIDVDDELKLNYNNTWFCVYTPTMSIEVLQLSIIFPNYKKILNSVETTSNLKIDKNTLLDSIKRIISTSDKNNKTLMVSVFKDVVKLVCENDFIKNKSEEEIPCEYIGDKVSIGMNVFQIKKVLNILQEDVVNMSISSPSKPILLIENDVTILLSLMKTN